MSDSMLTGGSSIGDLILQAPEPVWAKIKKALGVQTRDKAAAIVQADDKARQKVMSIFSGEVKAQTERPTTRSGSVLIPKANPSVEERLPGQLYPVSKKAKVSF